ncbi:MAG: methylmalonyl Co-A mutase-associated GTPase MeaB [Deltaproteobacteria bacterium]|nr:methylmalonyl Co-A mutase-associated GTPase MeaB [Deltaproteobacteria bacterium]
MHPLVEKVLQGEVRATARLLRQIDDRVGSWREALAQLYPHTGRAEVLGITGNPGAGKSTLTDQLVASYRKDGRRVAVLAVDPTSPFSGGAILGDRIRMQRHALDPGVFIRSLATRGQLGGLSRSTADSVAVLDAFGAEVILVETVGVGQDELDIAKLAHSTVVVMAPGLGDDVQAVKAGLLEVADVFVVNKADRDGADATVRDLEMMIGLGHELLHSGAHSLGHAAGTLDLAREAHRTLAESEWLVPVVKTVASRGEGVPALREALAKHREHLAGTDRGAARRAQSARENLRVVFQALLLERATTCLGEHLERAAEAILARREDPYTAATELLERFLASPRAP